MNEDAEIDREAVRLPSLGIGFVVENERASDVVRGIDSFARAVDAAVRSKALAGADFYIIELSSPAVLAAETISDLTARHRERGIRGVECVRLDARGAGTTPIDREDWARGHDLIVLTDPTAIASLDLVVRLLAGLEDAEVGLVEARRIPLERVEDGPARAFEASARTLACALLRRQAIERTRDVRSGQALRSWRSRLAAAVGDTGLRVEYCPSAVVFLDERLERAGDAHPSDPNERGSSGPSTTNESRPLTPLARALAASTLPSDSVVLDPNTSIGALLGALAAVECRPETLERTELGTDDRPFLTVISRTQGRRVDPMREMLLCLAGQTSRNFEHLVVGVRLSPDERRNVERLIDELAEEQRARTRFLSDEGASRASPVNRALAQARGRYFAVLDDDDLVFGHWVETFESLVGGSGRGRVLRTVCVDRAITAVPTPSPGSFRTVGAIERNYPPEYDVFDHLERNRTPLMCLAFPTSLHRDFGMCFDEELTVCEDWEFQMRAVLAVGVTSSPEVTAIYRRWREGESSATLHQKATWVADLETIARRLDGAVHIFPPGTISHHLALAARVRFLESELAERRTQTIDDGIYRARKSGARWRRRAVELARTLAARIRNGRG